MKVPEFSQRWRWIIRIVLAAIIIVSCVGAVDALWAIVVDLGKARWPELEQIRPWPVFAICRQIAEVGILISSIPATICIFYIATHPRAKE